MTFTVFYGLNRCQESNRHCSNKECYSFQCLLQKVVQDKGHPKLGFNTKAHEGHLINRVQDKSTSRLKDMKKPIQEEGAEQGQIPDSGMVMKMLAISRMGEGQGQIPDSTTDNRKKEEQESRTQGL